jgi:hypothetical protein
MHRRDFRNHCGSSFSGWSARLRVASAARRTRLAWKQRPAIPADRSFNQGRGFRGYLACLDWSSRGGSLRLACRRLTTVLGQGLTRQQNRRAR